MIVKEACEGFEYAFRDLASPERAGEVAAMKAMTKDMAEKVNKMKVGMTEEDARRKGAAFYNMWKNTHIPSVGDETDGGSKKEGRAKGAKRAKKQKTNAESNDTGDRDADRFMPRILDMGNILCIF